MRLRTLAALGLVTTAWTTPARADDTNPYAPGSNGSATGDAVEPSDHDDQVGLIALAYHGTRAIPSLATGGSHVVVADDGSATLTVTPDSSTIPIFGVRYWFTRRIGLDVGAGIAFESGSFARRIPNPDPTKDRTEDGASARSLLLASRVALPISLHAGRHYNLMVIPDVTLGVSRASLPAFQKSTSGEDLDLQLTAVGIGAGARVGAEVSFGFVGVPELSVQAAWGVQLEAMKRTGRIGAAEATLSDLALGSSTGGGAWRWLTGGFSVFYGF